MYVVLKGGGCNERAKIKYLIMQARFFNVWPSSNGNEFAEILSLEANFLFSLAINVEKTNLF